MVMKEGCQKNMRPNIPIFQCSNLLLCIAWLCVATPAEATVAIGRNDFDSSLHGWYADDNWATVANPASGGNPDGWMSTTWTNLLDPDEGAEWWYNVFKTDATNLFTGTWTTNNWLEMDFWASNNAPEAVQVQWGTTGSRIWKYTVFDDVTDDMDLQTWTGLKSVRFNDYNEWRSPPLEYNEANFLNDLANIDWVGIKIWRGDMEADTYGIDNFSLMIPEPAEVILLLFAGMSSWMSLRKKRKNKG